MAGEPGMNRRVVRSFVLGRRREGFPRSRSQSVMLERAEFAGPIVVSLETSRGCREARLAARARAGDEAESQRAREVDWQMVSAPLLPHFAKRDELVSVDGEGTREEVTSRIVAAVASALDARRLSRVPATVREHLGACAPSGGPHVRRAGRWVLRVGSRFFKCAASLPEDEELLSSAQGHVAPLKTPMFVAKVRAEGVDLLVTEAVDGVDGKAWARTLAASDERDAFCAELATTMRRLHAAPPRGRRRDLLAEAAARLERGEVPLRNFGPKYVGDGPAPRERDSLRARFESLGTLPESAMVRIHGDPCLLNWIVREGRIVGVVDVGGHGLAPRGFDLALRHWSVVHNLGPEWGQRVLVHYDFPGISLGSREFAYFQELSRFLA